MKIDYVLMGVNKNPLYLDFWPIVAKVWKEVFNITPVLGLISDEEFNIYEDGNGLIIKLKTIEGYNDGLLSQLVRLYLPKYLKGNCLISDIDMIPLSKKYFINSIEEYNDDDLLIMSSHHEQTLNINQYPMCYVAGNNKVFSEIFNLNLDWKSFIKQIPNNGWFTDQVFLYEQIKRSNYNKCKFPYREFGVNSKRIDRINWVYDENKVKEDYYIDSHLLRPFNENETEINKLINLLY